MLVNTTAMLRKARLGNYAIGAFNVNDMELLQGILLAAEATHAPVMLQTSEGAIQYAGLDMLAGMLRIAAKAASVPVAVHLDHGKDLDVVRACIRAGYTSVMYDGSKLPYEENIRNTKKVVRWAHAKNISVEAELGAIMGTEDLVTVSEREASFTIPEQALDFVTRTKCDSLAISIGTAHGAVKFKGEAKLDMKRLRRIRALLPKTPLVLHGASGVAEELIDATQRHCQLLGDCHRLEGAVGVPRTQLRTAIRNGICKVNTDTDLRIAFTAAVREVLVTEKRVFDPRKILGPARDAVQRVVAQRIADMGSKGKA
jgi:fructose-bisphosphate aldolase, class II